MTLDTGHLVHSMIDELGINPMLVYCTMTGKPFATLSAEEFQFTIDEILATNDECDEDTAIDELLTRTVSTMRPSPSWNIQDESMLQRYIKTRPGEVMAYCLNRLYEPAGSLKISFSLRLHNYHQRILRWQLINELTQTMTDMSAWLYMLIEIDAKYNLTTLPIPHDTLPLPFSIMDMDGGFDAFMEEWKKWYFPLKDSYEKRLREELRADRWLKGNTLAKGAFFTLFMDSQPPTKSAIEKAKKKEESDFFSQVWSDVMRDQAEKGKDSATVRAEIKAVGTTKAPRRFGTKVQA